MWIILTCVLLITNCLFGYILWKVIDRAYRLKEVAKGYEKFLENYYDIVDVMENFQTHLKQIKDLNTFYSNDTTIINLLDHATFVANYIKDIASNFQESVQDQDSIKKKEVGLVPVTKKKKSKIKKDT
jgi:hypothetical protein